MTTLMTSMEWANMAHFYLVTTLSKYAGHARFVTALLVTVKDLETLEEESPEVAFTELPKEAGEALLKRLTGHELEDNAQWAIDHKGYLNMFLESTEG